MSLTTTRVTATLHLWYKVSVAGTRSITEDFFHKAPCFIKRVSVKGRLLCNILKPRKRKAVFKCEVTILPWHCKLCGGRGVESFSKVGWTKIF